MSTKTINTNLLLLIYNHFTMYKDFGNSTLTPFIPIVQKELLEYHHVSIREHNKTYIVKTI